MLSRLFRVYQKTISTYPYGSQMVQTGFLMGLGDVLCQKVIEQQKYINWTRTGKLTAVGFFYVGPLLTLWYRTLYKHVGSRGKKVVFIKLACDQLLFAPSLIGTLLPLFNILQGLSIDDNIAKVKHDYPTVLLRNYMLWPAVQIVNFKFVHLNYQVLVVQVVALFWNMYISWKVHQHVDLKHKMETHDGKEDK